MAETAESITEALTKLTSFQVALTATFKRIYFQEINDDCSMGICRVALKAIRAMDKVEFLLKHITDRFATEYQTQEVVREAQREFAEMEKL